MGKASVDVSGLVDEINEEALRIAEVSKRLEANRGSKVVAVESKPESRIAENKDALQKSLEHDQPKPDAAQRRRKRAQRAEDRKKSNGTNRVGEAGTGDDPWVTASVKMRNSKKQRFVKLSLERKLADKSPHEQQLLMDEALDYLLAKYG